MGRRLWLACMIAMTILAPATTLAQSPPPSTPWDTRIIQKDADWYASAEARRIADAVILYQSAEGGWPKNTAMITPPTGPLDPKLANTFDNHGTTLPTAFLARMVEATGSAAYRAAFDRGLDYMLAAQYPNGGWPQFYPLRNDYSAHITFNDDAMIRVLTLLRDVAQGRAPYGFVEPAQRARAAAAVARGADLILRTQIVQDGKLTVWCAQYDAVTLQPAWARRYEPPSLSGSESVAIVRFLMEIDDPSPQIVAAVEGATDWFRQAAIRDIRLETFVDAKGQRDSRVVAEPGAPLLWARFYELQTNRPIFLGRDSVVHYDFAPVERERRAGYRYYGEWPARLLAQLYPDWKRQRGAH